MNTASTPKHLIEILPLANSAWRELAIFGLPLLAIAVVLWWLGPPWHWVAAAPLAVLLMLIWFFRDPTRTVTDDPRAYLSPADGRVVEVTPVDGYDFLDGPAIRIGIFLSMFDVHINRVPRSGRVLETDYQRGEFVNALNADSSERNAYQWVGFEDQEGRRFAVRQIAGLVARRIVCELRPGILVQSGDKYGMIKFGSRTELIVPADTEVACGVGDKVRAGVTVLARRP